jgi:Flp pilus assembly protein TadG
MDRPSMSAPLSRVLAFRIRLPGPVARRVRGRAGRRGQSLTEFAITLPVVLTLVLFGLDFGRVFLGWVTLTNAAREAANFAAMNPTAWGTTPSVAIQAEYARLVAAETVGANCTMPNPVPDPTFPDGKGLGSPASVSIVCTFHLITPVIGQIVGNLVSVTASSAFPVRSGLIEGIPTPSPTPSTSAGASTSPSGSTSPGGSAAPSGSPSGTPSPTGTALVSPSPTATPMCTVPNLRNLKTNVATTTWTTSGFTAGNLIFSPLVGPKNNYSIKDQSRTAGTSTACTSSMIVYDKVQH